MSEFGSCRPIDEEYRTVRASRDHIKVLKVSVIVLKVSIKILKVSIKVLKIPVRYRALSALSFLLMTVQSPKSQGSFGLASETQIYFQMGISAPL